MEMILDKGSQIIFDLLQKNGYKVYLVGGSVRDSLLKIEYTDYDFTTNCPIDMLYEIFIGYKINCLNKYLSSIKVYIDNKEKFDLHLWVCLDKNIFIHVTDLNANEIIKYLFERYPY